MIRMYLLGGILAGLVAAFGLFCWRMHSRGWDAATAHYKAVVDSVMATNESNQQTIATLEQANRQWADAMKGNAAKLSEAVEQLKVAQADRAEALADAQRKLRQVIHATHTSSVWGATRVPAAVLCQLQHASCPDPDRTGTGASDPAGAH